MRAVAYVRVSTVGQAEDGVGLDVQRAKVQAWASLNDAELLDVVADEGLSAKSMNRPGLQKAMALAKANKTTLVVYSLSRLSRSTKDTLSIVAELEKSGCELVSLSERIDTSSAGGRMVFRMMAVLAEFEREQVAERTRHAMQHMKSQGRVVGSVPHGFVRVGNELAVNPDEARVIELAESLRAKGFSLRGISDELARAGAFNRAGRPYNPNSIRSMLQAA
jgi:DNA invertase Pin-like site-specific DNA recombinase